MLKSTFVQGGKTEKGQRGMWISSWLGLQMKNNARSETSICHKEFTFTPHFKIIEADETPQLRTEMRISKILHNTDNAHPPF